MQPLGEHHRVQGRHGVVVGDPIEVEISNASHIPKSIVSHVSGVGIIDVGCDDGLRVGTDHGREAGRMIVETAEDRRTVVAAHDVVGVAIAGPTSPRR